MNNPNFQQIETLCEYALHDPSNDHQVLILMENLEENIIERIKTETGIDLTGFAIEIDNYGIKHAFEGHGNPIKEAKHGQIAITEEDYLLIPLIIMDFDKVSYNEMINGKTVEPALVFEKEIDGRYFVVKQIKIVTKKGKRNRLIFKTMYKKRSNKP
jgi:hypothetical protein